MAPPAAKKSRKKNQSNEQLCRQLLRKYRDIILSGRIVCIDPSSASKSSKPGYAIFEAGVLVEAGILDIADKYDLRVRLRLVHEELQQFIEGTNLVIIEAIPLRPIRTKLDAAASGKTWMNAKAFSSLTQALGVTKAAFPKEIPQLDLPATLWNRVAREQGWGMSDTGEVIKTDTTDAVRIGMTAIHLVSEKQHA